MTGIAAIFQFILDYGVLVSLIFSAIHYKTLIFLCIDVSVAAAIILNRIIPELSKLLLAAGICGKDMNKEKEAIIPESLGLAIGVVYLCALFIFMPFPFLNWQTPFDESYAPTQHPFKQVPIWQLSCLAW